MKGSSLLILLFLFIAGVCNVYAGTYYVDRDHPAANDSNAGTEDFPWETIVHAADVADAGDTVFIKAGIYADGDVVVANSGVAGEEIVFTAYPGHERQAVIKGAAFRSFGKSHFRVHGLKVLESPSYGFRFQGPADPTEPPAENIVISGVHTYDTCSSGIAVWGVKWGENPGDYDNIRDVIIEDNLLELGTHGCKNEIITVANGAVNITVRNNEIRLGDPAKEGGDEGIDFKEGVRDSRIHGNYIHHLSDKAIYIDGGSDPSDPLISNIHIYDNVMMHLPSAGIVVTTEGLGDVDGVYVYNNIVAHVDGDGYRVYDHPGGNAEGGTVKNVHFINNTAFDTGLEYGGGFRVNHDTATGIVFRNNIAWSNKDYDIRPAAETLTEGNLCAESFCEVSEVPQFIDSWNDDFRLQASSPAIDRGLFQGGPAVDIAGTPRPQGAALDLGAYEFIVNDPVPGPDTESPSVVVTHPSGGSVSGSVIIQVDASDNIGVEVIEIYLDGKMLAADNLPPYTVSWNTMTHGDGSAIIEARAFDAAGNMGKHNVLISVDNQPPEDTTSPTVSFTSPAEGATVSGTFGVSISAADEAGIASVSLYIDGDLYGADTSAPYAFSWNTRKASTGAHELKAVAVDSNGNTSSLKQPVIVAKNTKGDKGKGRK